MNSAVVYIVVFIIVFLPTFLVYEFLNYGGASSKDDRGSVEKLPPLYRLAYTPIKVLASFGLGRGLSQLRVEKTKFYEKRIVVANLRLKAEMVHLAQLFYSIVLTLFSLFFSFALALESHWILMTLLIGFFLGWVYPAVVVESLADARQKEITRTVPFAIDLIASAMRSGLDFGAALRYFVSQKIPGALTYEFSMMLKQIELGKTRVEALNNMAERVDTKEFSSFVASVAHGTEVGASITDTMDMQGEDMRRARFNLAEQQAARAPSLMLLPMALFILPSVFIIIFVPIYLKVQASGMGTMFK